MSRTSPVYRENLDHYASRFEAFAAEQNGDPAWLIDLRAQSMARFQELGFPSPRLEEWRYTNTAPIAALAPELPRADGAPSEAGSAGIPASQLRAERALLSDARVAAPLPSPPGVTVESLARLREDAPDRLKALLARSPDFKDRSFALLNTAFLDDGLAVTFSDSKPSERKPSDSMPRSGDSTPGRPLYLLLTASAGAGPGGIRHPRIFLTASPGSRATVVVDCISISASRTGSAPVLTNSVIDVLVGANASLDLVLLQRERDDCFHVSTTTARVERDGALTTHTLSLGGRFVRNDLDVVLADEGASCSVRGLFLGSGTRLVDNHTTVDHAMPHGSSRELYKGVLADRSRGVFRGRVIVRPGAQKTDATQSNANLLLDAGAEIYTKPQLEIYADDVKCSHGSTIGQLDADALFYLRSRGIGAEDARALLTRAFASEIADAIPGAELASALNGLVASAMDGVATPAPGALS
jgi:Fe-S cluster assembly protein SufD